MSDFDSKIETFTNLTLTQAAKARDKIFEKCENEKKEELAEFLNESEKNFAKLFKEESVKISTENHRNVSKAVTECKKELFSHREELIGKLFYDLNTKISEFKKTDAYADFLEKCIKNGIETIGGSSFSMVFDAEDEKIGGELAKKHNADVSFEDGLIGGVIISAPGSAVACNMSMSAHIARLRENFLENSGFSIDVM